MPGVTAGFSPVVVIMSKEFSKAFYKSARWLKCRQSYIKSVNGVCERCGNPGYILHHKILLTPENINDPDVTLNFENLEFVCLQCHNMDDDNEHGEHDVTYTKYRVSSDGEILPP